MKSPGLLSLSFSTNSVSRDLFSSTDTYMKTVIANSILSFFNNSTNNAVQPKEVSNMSDTVVNLVNYSDVSQQTFNFKCNELVSSRKKSAKLLFQRTWEVYGICGKNSKH